MKIKRLKKLEDYLRSGQMCTYEELCRAFDVSLSTIHRDIDELEKMGSVEKIHGGAIYRGMQDEDAMAGLTYDYVKGAIARRAAASIEDNDIILLGSGSTVAHMVPFLKGKKNITVITNNFLVIGEAMNYDFNVINIGGNLDRNVMSFVGTQSIKQLQELNANKAFIGCNGISANGFSNVVDLEADIKKAMIHISSQATVLAESRKFGAMSLYNFAALSEVHTLVTEKEPDEEYQKLLAEAGVNLAIAEL